MSPGVSVVRALAGEVKPVFSLPPVAVAVAGAVLADRVVLGPLVLHAAAVFFAIYAAHLRDSEVDVYVRGEDDATGLSRREYRVAFRAVMTGFLLVTVGLAFVDALGAFLTLPLGVLAWLHAPYLDRRPVPTTLDYPLGVGFTLLGGYAVQAHALVLAPVVLAAAFVVLLAGLVVRADLLDYDADAALAKRTVPVALGRARARVASPLLVLAACGLVAVAVAVGVFQPVALLAPVGPLAAVVAATRLDDRAAFRLLVAAVYPFALVLLYALAG